MDTLLGALLVLVVALLAWLLPVKTRAKVITLGDTDYQLEAIGDKKVHIRFSRKGVDFKYTQDFEEMEVRDNYISTFSWPEALVVYHELTGTVPDIVVWGYNRYSMCRKIRNALGGYKEVAVSERNLPIILDQAYIRSGSQLSVAPNPIPTWSSRQETWHIET